MYIYTLIYVNIRFPYGARPKLASLVSAARFHVKLVRKRTHLFWQKMFHVKLVRKRTRSYLQKQIDLNKEYYQCGRLAAA